MNPEQLLAIADNCGMRENPSLQAARMVLVDGIAPAEAARQAGISPSGVGNALRRLRESYVKACRAAGVEPQPIMERAAQSGLATTPPPAA